MARKKRKQLESGESVSGVEQGEVGKIAKKSAGEGGAEGSGGVGAKRAVGRRPEAAKESKSPAKEDGDGQQDSGGLVAPLASPTKAREMLDSFNSLKAALVEDGDCIWVVGQAIYSSSKEATRAAGGDKAKVRGALKKSGVLKLATAFGVNTQLVSETWDSKGEWVDLTVRASHPSGRSSEDTASCERRERRKPISRHTMRATAFTRARSRAILALIGGGEVSAEELTAGGEVSARAYQGSRHFGAPAQPIYRDRDPAPEDWRDGIFRAANKIGADLDMIKEDAGDWTVADCKRIRDRLKAGRYSSEPETSSSAA